MKAGAQDSMENITFVTQFILVGLSNNHKTQIVLFAVFLLIYLLTIVGNLVIIMLIQVDSHLQTPMYYFLTHLSILEICYISSTVPQMLAHLLAGNGAISFTRCAVQMYIALSLGSTEGLLLGAMAYDRYLAICHPLLYVIAMGRWRQLQLASSAWTGGFLLSILNVGCTLCLPFCGPNRVNHFFCELPVILKLACADTWITEAVIFGAAVLILLVPLSVILTSYSLILFSVLQMPSASGRHKAFSTCASHLAVVILFYGTVISMYMRPRSDTTTDIDKRIAVFYILVTPLLNPFIYTLRNKDVHNAVVKVFQRWGFQMKLQH
ncbi:olfactory receptor 2D3-like [Sphaerodactylus townsendi]|uniref:olfactory receptor 2D3-like n=1 Tax=Sphaerodactylus townsendi TaxID=933632 RepID=UPI00202664E3|nr:olfactory receptor 2D3-like [Sphaerodactylus townsendi]